MRTFYVVTIGVMVFAGGVGSAKADDTLFSCTLTNNSTVTIEKGHVQVYYSYGKQGSEPEMKLDSSMDTTFYYSELGENWSNNFFQFTRGQYYYIVYSNGTRAGMNDGLAVFKGSKMLMNKKCRGEATVDGIFYNASPDDFGVNPVGNNVEHILDKISG